MKGMISTGPSWYTASQTVVSPPGDAGVGTPGTTVAWIPAPVAPSRSGLGSIVMGRPAGSAESVCSHRLIEPSPPWPASPVPSAAVADDPGPGSTPSGAPPPGSAGP